MFFIKELGHLSHDSAEGLQEKPDSDTAGVLCMLNFQSSVVLTLTPGALERTKCHVPTNVCREDGVSLGVQAKEGFWGKQMQSTQLPQI